MKTFATEEEKNKAIEDFDERKGVESDLDEIMNAEIAPPPDNANNMSEGNSLEEPKPNATLIDPVTDTALVDQANKGKDEPGKLAALNQQVLEQSQYIKDNLSSVGRIKALEDKISQLSQTQTAETKEEKKEITLRESNLNDLRERKKKLVEQFPDPESQLDSDYITEMNAIQEGFFDEFDVVHNNLLVAQNKAVDAEAKANSYVSQKADEVASQKHKSAIDNEINQVEAFSKSHPDFTMSKPFREVDEDYSEYQKEVSKVYFGRDVKTLTEINEAMAQLKRKSPGLMTKLKAANVQIDLSDDQSKLLKLCDIWDHWTGYRKDPITGDFQRDKHGNVVQLKRYEPTTNSYIPDSFPSMDTAYNDKLSNDGYYTKKVLSAKIEGGKQAISAMGKRDMGATELGVVETSGGQQQALDEVYNKINDMDIEKIVLAARAGDLSLLNEYNTLAKAIGWPETNIEELA